MTTKNLIKQYEIICNELVKRFAKKQAFDFDFWIASEIGGVALFSDQYFFNLSDIILDLTEKQKPGFILEWQNDGVDYNIDNDIPRNINYQSYIMGMRYNQLT